MPRDRRPFRIHERALAGVAFSMATLLLSLFLSILIYRRNWHGGEVALGLGALAVVVSIHAAVLAVRALRRAGTGTASTVALLCVSWSVNAVLFFHQFVYANGRWL